MGPGLQVYARGRAACAESYREFASNAAVLDYSEREHSTRVWGDVAVHTFSWEMCYRREGEPSTERGTDQLVLHQVEGRWQVVWRYLHFEPSGA